jgi:hypothetical protein
MDGKYLSAERAHGRHKELWSKSRFANKLLGRVLVSIGDPTPLPLDLVVLGSKMAAEYCDENDERWRDGYENYRSRTGGFGAGVNVFSDEFLSGEL